MLRCGSTVQQYGGEHTYFYKERNNKIINSILGFDVCTFISAHDFWRIITKMNISFWINKNHSRHLFFLALDVTIENILKSFKNSILDV